MSNLLSMTQAFMENSLLWYLKVRLHLGGFTKTTYGNGTFFKYHHIYRVFKIVVELDFLSVSYFYIKKSRKKTISIHELHNSWMNTVLDVCYVTCKLKLSKLKLEKSYKNQISTEVLNNIKMKVSGFSHSVSHTIQLGELISPDPKDRQELKDDILI